MVPATHVPTALLVRPGRFGRAPTDVVPGVRADLQQGFEDRHHLDARVAICQRSERQRTKRGVLSQPLARGPLGPVQREHRVVPRDGTEVGERARQRDHTDLDWPRESKLVHGQRSRRHRSPRSRPRRRTQRRGHGLCGRCLRRTHHSERVCDLVRSARCGRLGQRHVHGDSLATNGGRPVETHCVRWNGGGHLRAQPLLQRPPAWDAQRPVTALHLTLLVEVRRVGRPT